VRVEHAVWLQDVALVRGGALLAIRFPGTNPQARLIDVPTGREVQVIRNCKAMALSGDGLRLACAGEAELAVWDVTSGDRIRSIAVRGRISAVALNATGTVIAAGRADGSIAFWEVSTGSATGEVLRDPGE
jgi:WD40 repeat protein